MGRTTALMAAIPMLLYMEKEWAKLRLSKIPVEKLKMAVIPVNSWASRATKPRYSVFLKGRPYLRLLTPTGGGGTGRRGA